MPVAVREDDDEEQVATKLEPNLLPQEDEQQQTVQTQVAHDSPIHRRAMEGEETAEEAQHSTPPLQRQMEDEEAVQTKRWHVQRTPLPGIRSLAGRLAGHAIQRLCTACAGENRQDEGQPQQIVHRQAALPPVPDDEDTQEQQVQRTGPQTPPPRVTPSLATNIHALNGSGSRLPDTTRAFFEPRFGADFSQVRVHTDARTTDSAKSVNAKAFTVGSDIYFANGQDAPSISTGDETLAHELTHVAQNDNGLVPQVATREQAISQPIGKDDEGDNPIQIRPAPSLAGSFDAGTDVETRSARVKARGSPLPDSVRAYMEPRFGVDFSHVRVHTGSDAIQMNQAVGAQAFTHGSDIYFGAEHSPNNLDLTAHELTHVVQQTGGAPLQTKKQGQPIVPLALRQLSNEVVLRAPKASTPAPRVLPTKKRWYNAKLIKKGGRCRSGEKGL